MTDGGRPATDLFNMTCECDRRMAVAVVEDCRKLFETVSTCVPTYSTRLCGAAGGRYSIRQ